MAANRLAILTLAVLAGCGGDRAASMAADSLSRDLQRLPVDSSAVLNDQAAATPVTPAPAPAPLTLAGGTALATTIDREITSKTDKPGATVTGTVASDVTDATGRVVIPAGSKVTMTITEIHESENKGDKTGKLTLTPTAVEIAGQSYPLDGSAVALDRTLRDRKTNAGDVAKVGAGTAAGAIVGRVIGGSTKGAVIGGIIGGAVGTQRAIETQDRDVVVPANSRVEVTLGGTFTR
jgi:hypothetical protein